MRRTPSADVSLDKRNVENLGSAVKNPVVDPWGRPMAVSMVSLSHKISDKKP
jgi:hypothetical protein